MRGHCQVFPRVLIGSNVSIRQSRNVPILEEVTATQSPGLREGFLRSSVLDEYATHLEWPLIALQLKQRERGHK